MAKRPWLPDFYKEESFVGGCLASLSDMASLWVSLHLPFSTRPFSTRKAAQLCLQLRLGVVSSNSCTKGQQNSDCVLKGCLVVVGKSFVECPDFE